MRCPSTVSDWRRELNSHNAAKPRDAQRLPLLAAHQTTAGRGSMEVAAPEATSKERLASNGSHRTFGLRRKSSHSVCSSGRRARQGQLRQGQEVRRLKSAVFHGQQRGAGCFSTRPRGITGPWQAHRLWLYCAVLPNPSLKRSANGRPPGPVWRYAVHFRQPGPGVLPSSPA